MKNQKGFFDNLNNENKPDEKPKKKSRNIKQSFNGLSLTDWVKNSKSVWDYLPGPRSHTTYQNQNVNIRLEHGATFSISLAKQLISIYSNVKDLIFDPFLGIGTTCVAAHQLNRKSIGIELNKTFYQTSLEYAYNTREIFDLNGDNNNYLQKNFNIINDDCRNMLKHIKADQVQFTLTSPPYANFIQKSINYRKKHKQSLIEHSNNSKIKQYSDDPKDLGNLNYNEYILDIKKILNLNYQITKQNGYSAWIVKDHRDTKNGKPYIPFHSDLAKAGEEAGWKYHDLIVLNQNENRSLVALGYPSVFYTNQNSSFVVIFRKTK